MTHTDWKTIVITAAGVVRLVVCGVDGAVIEATWGLLHTMLHLKVFPLNVHSKMLWQIWNELLAMSLYASHPSLFHPFLLFMQVKLTVVAGRERCLLPAGHVRNTVREINPGGIWIKCFDHLNWLFSTWWIDCSTLNSSHTPSTVSLLMSPETQRRKHFLLHPSGIIFFLSPAGAREHGRRLECKWSGKLRALPSGCAASSPRPSTTNKTPGTEHGCEVCHSGHTQSPETVTGKKSSCKIPICQHRALKRGRFSRLSVGKANLQCPQPSIILTHKSIDNNNNNTQGLN